LARARWLKRSSRRVETTINLWTVKSLITSVHGTWLAVVRERSSQASRYRAWIRWGRWLCPRFLILVSSLFRIALLSACIATFWVEKNPPSTSFFVPPQGFLIRNLRHLVCLWTPLAGFSCSTTTARAGSNHWLFRQQMSSVA